MVKYKWVLFDADHTLFDFDRASEEALSEVLAFHGVNWEQGMYADYKKINVECWMEHERGTMDRDTLIYERFKRYFDFMKLELDPVTTQETYLMNLGSKPYLMPGAEEIITWLERKANLGYITNGMTVVQRRRLESIDWHLRFQVIVIAGEIGCSKPHEDYFKHVHHQMGNPERSGVLVVGDSLTADIEGAASFGYDTCWFNPEGNECLSDSQPDYTIRHLSELRKVLSI